VADLRAPTPNGAGEKAVPVRLEIKNSLDNVGLRLNDSLIRLLNEKKIKLDEIQEKIQEQVSRKCEETYGICVDEVSIIQLSLPDVNLQSVFAQMEADRQKDIETILAEATRDADKIMAEADAESAAIIAQGVTEAAAIKAKTETEVAKIYAEAQAANLELYQFLRQLDTLIGSVNDQTSLIIRLDQYPFNILTKYDDLLSSADSSGKELAAAIAELPADKRQEVTDALWALIGQEKE
jgi:regulator of protease activity HflC (stomatin/prohibitin superfamily)